MNWYELLTNGLIFGIIDNLVLVAGVIWGLTCLESMIERSCNGRTSQKLCIMLGAIIGGGIGNTLSDLLGCLCDSTMIDSTVGITVGTQLPLIPAYLVWIWLMFRHRKEEKEIDSLPPPGRAETA